MLSKTRLSINLAVSFALIISFYTVKQIYASPLMESIALPDIEQVKTHGEMKAALESLNNSSQSAIKENRFTYDLQKRILTKSGECVSKIMSLCGNSAQITGGAIKDYKGLFLINRDMIKQILSLNENIIKDYQEGYLDKLEDPLAFFKSPEWQNPQNLISLSSYWLGWNGYYSSQLFSEDDPLKSVLIQEAIDGFSRAFIDFEEDTLIARSLFGRALCYKQIKAYAKALNDLKAIKEKTKKDDSIYQRCLYEEALINYQNGNSGLEDKSYEERGPLATMAIGDLFFDKKEYDKAISCYLMIHADSPPILKDSLDRICFRIGYIYCKNKKWKEAIDFLGDFHGKYPESLIMDQAASLYYTAASNNYFENPTKETYNNFIDSIQRYIKQCKGTCPGMSEARFQLGKYYQKTGKNRQALNEFSRVGKDSPNYLPARYTILQSYVSELESLEIRGLDRSKESDRLYRDGIELIKEYNKVKSEMKGSSVQKKIEPHMIILQAKLNLFGHDKGCYNRSLNSLERFENRFPGAKIHFCNAAAVRIICYHRLGLEKEAEMEVDRFLNTLPVNQVRYGTLHDLANRLYNEGKDHDNRNNKTALMIYKKLYAISRENTSFEKYCDPIQLRIAKIQMDNGLLVDAIDTYKDILQRDPLSANAVYDLGLLYETTGQWKEALDIWGRFSQGVTAGSHNWFESRYKTAYALNKLGKADEACEVIKMTILLHPDMGDDKLKKKYMDLRSKVCKGSP